MMDLERPIPVVPAADGWQQMEFGDNGEVLVDVQGVHPRIQVYPQYYHRKIHGAVEQVRARAGVVQRLVQAVQYLPEDIHLLVWDAWRPIAVQQALFDEYMADLAKQTGLQGDELVLATQTFVSLPSVNPPSPHATGGAVDLTLTLANGTLLDMGTPFDSFEDKAHTRYFEEHAETESDRVIQRNRRWLYNAMTGAGFTNYRSEWWHYDFGDGMYAKIHNETARYGYIE